MKLQQNLFTFLTLLCITAPVQASIITSGNIYAIVNDGNRVGSTVDHWFFQVNSAGFVTIDTLSWEVDSADIDLDGNFNELVDVNGDGEIAFFDPYVYLFRNDGVLDVSDFLDSNDDSSSTFADGSIFAFDSFLNASLPVGNYILAIGAYFLSLENAVAGVNVDPFYPTTADGLGNFLPIDHGDYAITWTGDVTIVQGPSIVPEPSSLAIFFVGCVSLSLGRRFCRKKVS